MKKIAMIGVPVAAALAGIAAFVLRRGKGKADQF